MNIKTLVRNKRKRQKKMLRMLKTQSVRNNSMNIESPAGGWLNEQDKDKFLKRVKSTEFQIQALQAKFG